MENTIAISDGITMGTEGMKTSLISREVIADSIELTTRGYMFDALVCLVGCDKTIPAASMALARLNIPGIIVYGGSILPGRFHGKDVTVKDVFEVVGRYAAGACPLEEVHALEKVACPGHGACGGQYTANTMACVGEAIGLSLPNSNMVPAPYTSREQIAHAAGVQVMDLLAKNIRPRDICTRQAFENAARIVAARPGRAIAGRAVIALAPPILHPLRYIAVHLMEAERVGRKLVHGQGPAAIFALLAAAFIDLIAGVIRLGRGDRGPPPERRSRARAAGISDLNRKYTMRDMVAGDLSFAATGITDGSLLEGVRVTKDSVFTHSVVMRGSTHTVRWIKTEHTDIGKFD